MATEQVLKTRILLKYDTYENWMSSSSILKPGEVALATISSGNTQEVNSVTPPQVLIKVGDGNNVYSALPFASAKAADVYSWAKEASFPFEETGSGNTITSVSWANNKLTFVKGDRVEEVTKGNEGIVIGGTKTKPTVAVVRSQATGNTLEIKNDGLYVPAPKEVTLPSYEDSAVAGQFVTEVDQVDGEISVKRSTISYEDLTDKPDINDGTLTLKIGNGLSGDDKTFSANDVDNVEFEINHAAKPTNGTAHETTEGTGRTYVTKVDVDEFGHIAKVYTATETDQDLSDYKVMQDPVNDPMANGSALAFIDSISQDENGEITVTKKNVDLSNYAQKSDIPDIQIVADNQVEVPTADTVNVYKNLIASGHTLTEELVTVPTKAYVDSKVAGAVQYLGTTSTTNPLSDLSQTAGKGDFYRVAAEIKSGDTVLAHAGDLLVAEKDEPAQQIDGVNWSVIHGDEGDITEVIAGYGLTGGGSTGSVTLNVSEGRGISIDSGVSAKIGDGLDFGVNDEIEVKPGNHIIVNENGVHHGAKPGTGTKHTTSSGSGRTYVTQVDVDDYGHIAKVYTATETVVDSWAGVSGNYYTKNEIDGQLANYVKTTALENYALKTDLNAYVTNDNLTKNYYTSTQVISVAQTTSGNVHAAVIGTSNDAATANTIYGAKKHAETYTDNIMNAFEGRRGIYVGYDANTKVYYAQLDPAVEFIYDCGGATF